MTRVATDPSALTGPERAATLSGAVVFHLLLLALFLSVDSAPAIPDTRSGVMSLIAIAPLPARRKPPPPALPSKVSDANRVATRMASTADPSTQVGAAGGCGTLDHINKAVVADPAAVAAVLASPRESRSIADAVVLWNDGWTSNASAANEPLGPTRLALENILLSLAPECLDEGIAGPRLVPIPAGTGTMFLVIGSGNWSWRQLLEQPEAIAASEDTGRDSVLNGI